MKPTETSEAAREVTFEGVGGLTLKGTLLPAAKTAGPAPAVLLLPGSGPPDRDGNIPPVFVTNVLKQIAERLAAAGIASLRFDKRSAAAYAQEWPQEPNKMRAFFRWESFTGDALAAYRFLRSQKGIDPQRVDIAGHSEGGLIALQLAHDLAGKPEAPAALALLATAGRALDVVVREQMAALLPKQLPDAKSVKTYLDYVERAIAQVKRDKTLPPDAPPPGLQALFNPSALEVLHAYFTIDPAELAKSARGPALIIQGADDTQVSAERDAPRLAAALKAREGAPPVEVLIVPKTSHNLKAVSGPGDPAFTGPIVPAALDKIAGWLKANLS